MTERGGYQRPPSMAINGHQCDYDFGFLWIAGSAILVLPQTQNIRRLRKNIRIRGKRVYTAKLSGFKSSRLQNLRNTKPGCFYFGFVFLYVNGKTNPVLKRSGFITNPEQFTLV